MAIHSRSCPCPEPCPYQNRTISAFFPLAQEGEWEGGKGREGAREEEERRKGARESGGKEGRRKGEKIGGRKIIDLVCGPPFRRTFLLAAVSCSSSTALDHIFTERGMCRMACATTALAWSDGWGWESDTC